MRKRSLIKNGFLLLIFTLTIIITFNAKSTPTEVDPLADVNIEGLRNLFYRSIASTGGIANPPFNYLADAKTTFMGYNIGTLGKISHYELQQIASNFLHQVTSSDGYDLYTFYDGHQTLESMFWGHQLKTVLFPEQKAISAQEYEIRLSIAKYVTEIYRKFGSFTYNFEDLYFITKLFSQIDELESSVSSILLKFYAYEWLENKEENSTISDIFYALESLKILEEEIMDIKESFVLNKPFSYRLKKELLDHEKVKTLSNYEIFQRLAIIEEENPTNLDIIQSKLRPIILERTRPFVKKEFHLMDREEFVGLWGNYQVEYVSPRRVPADETFLFGLLIKTRQPDTYDFTVRVITDEAKKEYKRKLKVIVK